MSKKCDSLCKELLGASTDELRALAQSSVDSNRRLAQLYRGANQAHRAAIHEATAAAYALLVDGRPALQSMVHVIIASDLYGLDDDEMYSIQHGLHERFALGRHPESAA